MFGSKHDPRIDRLVQQVENLRDDLERANARIAALQRSAANPPFTAPVDASAGGASMLAEQSPSASRLERRIEEVNLNAINRSTELAEQCTKAMNLIEAVGKSGSNNVEHMLKLSYESAALSQFLLMLGSYLEVNGIVKRGGLCKIFDTLVGQMDIDMRTYAIRVIGNLENWRNHS